MVRPLSISGTGLIVLLLWFGFCQQGWTEDRDTVKPGDTLYVISKSTGVSTEALKKANALKNDAVKPRQVLTVPSQGGKKAEEAAGKQKDAGQPEADAEAVPSVPLGKWGHPGERGLLVRVAKAFLGVPYRLGGSTLKGIDCSALVKKVYEIFDVHLPRTAREQFKVGKKIEKDQLEEGDLVFFRRRGDRAHVGIYVGDNQFVHASSYSREVRIDYLNTPYYSERFLRGVRVMEPDRKI
jgi:peptidoglycan endopeptidase LytE